MIPYHKQQVLQQLIQQLERTSGIVAKAAERTRQEAITAEGRMQTRYGSEKEETGYLADGLSQRNQEIQKGIDLLRSFTLPQISHRVERGCLVRLADERGEPNDYFILPYGGGESLATEYGEITVLSPTAPLGRLILNKTKGDRLPFNGAKQNYTIVDVL